VSFNEHSDKAHAIMLDVETFFFAMEKKHLVIFKSPFHDGARRFLNEIMEFEPIDKDGG